MEESAVLHRYLPTNEYAEDSLPVPVTWQEEKGPEANKGVTTDGEMVSTCQTNDDCERVEEQSRMKSVVIYTTVHTLAIGQAVASLGILLLFLWDYALCYH